MNEPVRERDRTAEGEAETTQRGVDAVGSFMCARRMLHIVMGLWFIIIFENYSTIEVLVERWETPWPNTRFLFKLIKIIKVQDCKLKPLQWDL